MGQRLQNMVERGDYSATPSKSFNLYSWAVPQSNTKAKEESRPTRQKPHQYDTVSISG